MVRRRRAWHDITALGQHTWSEDVGCGMTSTPLDGKQGQTTSGVACHHHLWEVQTVERHRVWHSIIAFGLAHIVGRRQACHAIITLGWQKRSNVVGRGMPSSPLGSTHGRTTFDVACHHRRWTSSHSRTASGVACHHRHWTANTVERRRAWHAIITFGLADTVGRRQAWHAIITFWQHRRSNDVGRGIPSSHKGRLT